MPDSANQALAELNTGLIKKAQSNSPDSRGRLSLHDPRLYDVSVHFLAQQLLNHIRRHDLLRAGDRVGVAVSGGIDSVALLRLLLELRFELGIVLSVVHFNHQLRGAESDEDEEFVRNLTRERDLEFYVDQADVAARAREEGVSVETAARELRYEFFRELIRERDTSREVKDPTLSQDAREAWGNHSSASKLDKIATGHTLDDQAETVLMRIIRGAGMRGLGAIYPRIEVEDNDGEHCGEIVRPLLETRRTQLEGYLKDIDQSWREDSTNADHHFTRNRVRKLLVPVIEKEFNPKIAEGLAELAKIAREEEDYWENEIAGWMGTAVHWTGVDSHVSQKRRDVGHPEFVQIQPVGSPQSSSAPPAMNASVDRLWFLGEPVAVQRRLTKAIAEEAGIPLEFKHVDEIVRFAAESEPSGKELALPLGWKLLRESDALIFVAPDLHPRRASADYEYALPVPGRVLVNEISSEFEMRVMEHEEFPDELDRLLDTECLAKSLTIRNWRAGDRFWPAHTKAPKKIKELLTELHVAHTSRSTWPVVSSGDEIVWVRGLPVSSRHRAKAGQPALLIHETPVLSDESV
jgi:tRNA(Ile)-lysidine synthase